MRTKAKNELTIASESAPSSVNVRILNKKASNGNKKIVVSIGKKFPIELELTYSRDSYTPKVEREMNELMKQVLPGHSLAKWILTVVRDWNVTEDDPDPDNLLLPENQRKQVKLALTEENLIALVTIEAQAKIVDAIAKDQNPNLNSLENTSDSF